MPEQKEIEGLSVLRLDLVGRYVAAAAGPPPRVPLRFWTGGEWVEVSPAEPEIVAAATFATTASGADDTVDPWSAVRARELPVYRWVLERVADENGLGRPRSLAPASGSGRPIGRRPAL
jgi:hypothetical protein